MRLISSLDNLPLLPAVVCAGDLLEEMPIEHTIGRAILCGVAVVASCYSFSRDGGVDPVEI